MISMKMRRMHKKSKAMKENKEIWEKAKRIVVKIGSSLVTNEGKGVDLDAINRWVSQFRHLQEQGKEVILVSSGAIAEGVVRLGFEKRPTEIHELQACAAVGQMGLAHAYEKCFAAHDLVAAQLLLTHADLANRERYLNARHTLLALLKLKAVPIINENDTVITDEIKVGDNDTLGALTTNLVDADILVILTDQEGMFTADPRNDPNAELISRAAAGSADLESMAGGAGSSIGKGGMLTKILAAKRAARSGASTVIVSGRIPDVLVRLSEGESLGTLLVSESEPLSARRQWMADHLQLKGYCVIDEGAVQAIRKGKSLLPIGVKSVQGEFLRGEVISCFDQEGKEVARGLSNFSAETARKLKGKHSTEIEETVGYIERQELIHHDNMIVIQSAN